MAPAKDKSAFDRLAPKEIVPEPLKSSETAKPTSKTSMFDKLLPSSLKDLAPANVDTSTKSSNKNTVASKDAFPLPANLGSLSVAEAKPDNNRASEDDFRFDKLIADVPGAADLLAGGARRLQAEDVSDVSTVLLGSANLAL